MKKKIFINMFSNNLGHLFQIILGFILVPFLIKVLKGEGYGLIVLAESLIVFFELCAAGIRIALGRYVGISLAQNNNKEANAYIASGEAILLSIVAFLSISGVFIWYFFNSLFRVPEAFQGETKIFVLPMIISFILQIKFIPYWSILYSRQRFDLMNLYTGFRNIIRCLLSFFIYSVLPPKLYYYGYIYFFAVSIELFLVMRGSKKLFPELRVSTKNLSGSKMRELSSFMAFKTLDYVSSVLYTSTDMVLINRYIGPYSNAVYAISLKFIEVLKKFIQRSLWVLVPSFTELVGKNEHERLKHIFFSVTKASSLITIPVCAMLALFGKDLILFWVGDKFIGAVVPMYIHILAICPGLIFTTASGILTAYGKVRVPSYAAIFFAILNIVISLFCVLKLGWGLSGFAFGTFVSSFTQYIFFIPFYACMTSKYSFKDLYINSFIKPLILNVILGFVLFYLKFILNISFIYITLYIILLSPVYILLIYLLLLNTYERSHLKNIKSKLLFLFKKSN